MKKLIEQFVKFGMVGAVNTISGLIIYWVLVHFGVHYLIANAVGFAITVAISYCLNNIFTFKDKGIEPNWSVVALLKSYVSYSVTGIFLNSVLLWFWNDYVGINRDIAPVLNLFVTIPINFILNKLWVFEKGELPQGDRISAILSKYMRSGISFLLGLASLIFYIASVMISSSVETSKYITLIRIAVISLSALCYLACFITLHDNKAYRRQFSWINVFFTAFNVLLVLVTIRTVVYIHYLSQMYMEFIWLATGVLVLWLGRDELIKSACSLKDKDIRFWFLFALAVSFVLIALSYDVDGPHFVWDSATMHDEVYERTVADLFDISRFFVFGHVDPAYFYPICLLRELFGSIRLAFWLENAVCLVATSFGTVFLLRKTLSDHGRVYIVLSSLAILLSPYILGISTYYSYDYAICCLAPILFLTAFNGEWLYFFTTGMLISLMKEPGVIFVGSVCAGIILMEVIEGKSIKSILLLKRTMSWLFIAANFIMVYLVYSGWGVTMSGNGFMIDVGHIIRQIKVYLVLNFEWLVALGGMILTVICLLAKKKLPAFVAGYITSAVLFLIFNLVYVTYEAPRYTDAFPICLILVVITLLPLVFKGVSKLWVMTAVMLLMLVSSFVSVDPVSAIIIPSNDVGNGIMYGILGDGIGGDQSVYNRQYYGLDVVYERCLKKAINSDSDLIAVSLGKDTLTWGMDGGHYSYEEENSRRFFTEFWDLKDGRRIPTYSYDHYSNPDVKAFDIRYIFPKDDTIEALDEGRSFTYIYIPTNNRGAEQKIKEKYDIIDEGSFESHGWIMSYIMGTSD